MGKVPREIIFRVTPWIFLLVLPLLLYVDILWGNIIRFDQRLHYISTSSSQSVYIIRKAVVDEAVVEEEKHDSFDAILSALVKGEDQEKFKSTGFACNTEIYSKHCVTNQPISIDTRTMVFTIFSNRSIKEEATTIKPYARQEDETLLQRVTPVKILRAGSNDTEKRANNCDYYHNTPAIVFSSSGFVGNVFHEMNEIIIPLYITSRRFGSRAVFVLEDYNPSFVAKYKKILDGLTSHEIVNPSANNSVHCFPGGVVGLKFHGHLSLNSSDVPLGLTMRGFRVFLRRSLGLRYGHVSEMRGQGQPRLMFLSRRTTRRIINEDEVVSMLRELGFRVVVVARAKVISNLNLFASIINSCSVFVSTHGAGLTNEVFLPDGAVMVQVDLIGLEWAGEAYYGGPARAMGVRYLRYKIEPEESSLVRVFGSRDHLAIRDPKWLPVEAGKEVYLNGQNVRINVSRFRETMVEAMSYVDGLDL